MNMKFSQPGSPSSQLPWHHDIYGNPTTDHPDLIHAPGEEFPGHAEYVALAGKQMYISKTDSDYNGDPEDPFDIAYTNLPILRRRDIKPGLLYYDPQGEFDESMYVGESYIIKAPKEEVEESMDDGEDDKINLPADSLNKPNLVSEDDSDGGSDNKEDDKLVDIATITKVSYNGDNTDETWEFDRQERTFKWIQNNLAPIMVRKENLETY